MAREYFPAYHSYLEVMEALTDAEKGRLFTACLLYSKTGEVPQLSGNERYLFPAFKSQIDRDKKSYDEYSAAQAEKARKRWDAAACSGIRGIAENAKEKEKEKKEKVDLSFMGNRTKLSMNAINANKRLMKKMKK